jgi:HEAT repeat protein
MHWAALCLLALLTGWADAQEKKPAAEANKSVEQLLKDLTDKDSDVRAEAAESLGKLGAANKEAVEAAKKAVDAAKEMGAVPREVAAKQAVVAAKEAVAAAAAKAPVPALIKALKDDKDEDVRDRAAEALGAFGDPAESAVPALTEALKDKSAMVRASAAEALGELHEWILANSDTVTALLALLKDPDVDVRETVADALNEIGPLTAAAIPALVEALGDTSAVVRELAAETLGDLGPMGKDKDAEKALIKALKDTEKEVRASAAEALMLIKPQTPAAVQALVDARNDDVISVRCAVAEALGVNGHAHLAVPALNEMLKDKKHHRVQIAAADGLGNFFAGKAKLGDLGKDAVKELEAAIKEAPRSKVAEAARKALAQIKK